MIIHEGTRLKLTWHVLVTNRLLQLFRSEDLIINVEDRVGEGASFCCHRNQDESFAVSRFGYFCHHRV